LFITIIAIYLLRCSSPKGLVVPVIRNAESLSMADIEKEVVQLATKAKESNNLCRWSGEISSWFS